MALDLPVVGQTRDPEWATKLNGALTQLDAGKADLDDAGLLVEDQLPERLSETQLTATFAPVVSPAFIGTPTAPTPGSSDSSTKVATTAFVQGAAGPAVSAALAVPGVVSSQAIAAGAVTWSKAAFLTSGKNLFDPSAASTGFSIHVSTGALDVLAGYSVTDYIPVAAGQKVTFSNPRSIAFYKADKTFVSGSGVNNSTQAVLTGTATVAGYVRATVSDAYKPTFQAEYGATQTTYEPFKLLMPNLAVTGSNTTLAVNTIRVVKAGTRFTITSILANGSQLDIVVDTATSSNGSFTFVQTNLNGLQIHDSGDDVTPIRTFDTVGGNHGYANCVFQYTVSGHDKTTADLGSIYTDGTNQYTLLAISGSNVTFGGGYTVSSGVVTGKTTAPAATLTFVSGGPHTTSVPITTLVAGAQLLPSINQKAMTVTLDGAPVTVDGTYTGRSLSFAEAYTIMDWKGIIDWAQAHVGSTYASDSTPGVVRMLVNYTFTPKGKCVVSTSLRALTAVTLGECGFVQSAPMSAVGYTVSRQMPGVVAKSGFDFSGLVPLSSYTTSLTFGPGDYLDAAKPPDHTNDVLYDSTSTPVLQFALGYVTDKTTGKDADRINLARTWDMRNTGKNYPVALFNPTLAAGDLFSVEAYRAYSAPTTVPGAFGATTIQDGQASYVLLDIATAGTSIPVPLPDLIGQPIAVLYTSGVTVLNDTVDASGILVDATAKSYAIIKVG